MDIQINVPMCDYVTLTTFDPAAAKDARQWLFSSGVAGELLREGAKQHQYTGWQFEYGFLGAGEQAGLIHNLLRISGQAAHYALRQLVIADCSAWACRRLDAQVTIVKPPEWSSRRFADYVKASDTRGRGVRLIENLSNGLDTVYVGSRTSNRFARYYVKAAASGHLLRYEVEVKGERAESAFRQMCASGRIHPTAAVILREFQAGYSGSNTARMFDKYLAGGEKAGGGEIVKGERNTEEWLRSVILKSLISYAARGDAEYSQACGWVGAAGDRLRMMRDEK